MKTYNRQRREFILLAMKLIERDGLNNFHSLELKENSSILNYGRLDIVVIIRGCDKHNEAEIQKLRDLLRSEE